MNRKNRFPRIGMRITKSALAVGICFLIYYLRGSHGIPFYSAIAALQCLQSYHDHSRKVALRRINGTLIGAAYGLLVIVIQCFVIVPYNIHYSVYCLVVMLGVVAALYTAVILNCKDAAYFSSVVFLCIAMVHIGDENPYLFVFNRVVETLIGVGVGMGVNAFHLPRRKRTGVLFVTALDDVLISENARFSDYSKVELNRLLDEGIPLSIMTRRSTASYLEAAGDVRVRLPLILMDGAVLYDPVEHRYIAKCELDYEKAGRLTETLRSLGLEVFQNVVMDDSSLIFYESLSHKSSRRLYDRMRKSPYRNYINRPLPEGQPVVYLTSIDERETIQAAYQALQAQGETERYKIVCSDAGDFPGLAFLRIYNKDAEKLNMLEKLKDVTGYSSAVTFGSIRENYDVYVHAPTGDDVAKFLRKEFEPVIWSRKSRVDCIRSEGKRRPV